MLQGAHLSNHDLGDSYEMLANLIKRFIDGGVGRGGPTQGSIQHRRKTNTKKNFIRRILIRIVNGLAAR